MPTVNRYIRLKEFLHFYIVFVKQLTHGAIYIPVRNQTPIKQGIMHSFFPEFCFFLLKMQNIFEKVTQPNELRHIFSFDLFYFKMGMME